MGVLQQQISAGRIVDAEVDTLLEHIVQRYQELEGELTDQDHSDEVYTTINTNCCCCKSKDGQRLLAKSKTTWCSYFKCTTIIPGKRCPTTNQGCNIPDEAGNKAHL